MHFAADGDIGLIDGDGDRTITGEGQDVTIRRKKDGNGSTTLVNFGAVKIREKKDGRGGLTLRQCRSFEVDEVNGEGDLELLFQGPKTIARKDGDGDVIYWEQAPRVGSFNGNGNIRQVSSAREVANVILETSSNGRSKGTVAMPAHIPFAAIASQFDELADGDERMRERLQDVGVETARKWLFEHGHSVTTTDDFKAYLRAPTVMKGGTVARAFWWGWHVEISHEDLVTFLAAATTVNTIVGAIGGGIPSPAQPFIVLAATFVKGALGLLQSLDNGRGVYVSMSWFAPGVFVPTSV
jgi:hypothetical protein